MNFNQLRALVFVIEKGGFSRAAQYIGVSQPAVSFQIRGLEESLGVTLVVRSSHRLDLTPEGQVVYRFAKKTLNQLSVLKQELAQLAGSISGPLVLGASTIPGEYLLPRIVGCFKGHYPGVEVTLRIADSRQVQLWLLQQEVDVGVVGSYCGHPQLAVVNTWQDQLLAVVAPRHPWANREKVTLWDLPKVPIILREAGSGTRAVFAERLREEGVPVADLEVAMELGSTNAALAAAEAGLGVTIVSSWAAAKSLALGQVVAVEIEGLNLSRQLFLLRHSSPTPNNRVVEEFCQFARDYNVEGS